MLMLAIKHDSSNPLNAVYLKYHGRLSNEQLEDYTVLTTLYLSVFRPSDVAEVDTLLEKYKGKEEELFSKLVSSFPTVRVLCTSSVADILSFESNLQKKLTFCRLSMLFYHSQPIFVRSIR